MACLLTRNRSRCADPACCPIRSTASRGLAVGDSHESSLIATRHSWRKCGSRASLTPSPIRLNATAASVIAIPG